LAITAENIHIKPLRTRDHVRGAFSCTVPKIQNYCRNNIHRQNDAYQVRAYVACAGNALDVLGYYYLNLTSYKIGRLDDKADEKFQRVDAVPAVYLGMIGVHTDCQGLGIGKLLMRDAMLRTVQIAELAGTYALALDALDDKLVAYYSQFGFQTFKDPEKEKGGIEMFLPIKTIQAAISGTAGIAVPIRSRGQVSALAASGKD
jgi:ribosomal protein S18 acetylase RimI-like enzyme